MANTMPERMSDTMPERMPDKMPERMSEYVQTYPDIMLDRM
jgi:hypothetical protein